MSEQELEKQDISVPESDEAVEFEQEQAEARKRELEHKVAEFIELIREHSYQGELVKVIDLEFAEDFSEAEREEVLARLLAVDEIEKLESSDGRVFFYSSSLMVERYARVLLQREENDPKLLVAETVREESQLYPRPTSVEVFTLAPFKIPPQILETIIAELVADEADYADIKESVASTGARYLYSERHLEKQYADYLVEWKEVGQYENQ